MPIYEYQCAECEHIEEVLQKGTDGFYFLGKGCPNCGSSGNMTRILSLSSFQLKGGGWAADNYEKSKKSSEKT